MGPFLADLIAAHIYKALRPPPPLGPRAPVSCIFCTHCHWLLGGFWETDRFGCSLFSLEFHRVKSPNTSTAVQSCLRLGYFQKILPIEATFYFVQGDSGMEHPTPDKGASFFCPVDPLGLALATMI